jgi:hypothetical protein
MLTIIIHFERAGAQISSQRFSARIARICTAKMLPLSMVGSGNGGGELFVNSAA